MVKTIMRSQTLRASREGEQVQGGPPPRRVRHLPAIGRNWGWGRCGPEGVVHGAAAAPQVGPSVCSCSSGGWIWEARHCGREERGESRDTVKCTCSLVRTVFPTLFVLGLPFLGKIQRANSSAVRLETKVVSMAWV